MTAGSQRFLITITVTVTGEASTTIVWGCTYEIDEVCR